ncbi:LapA family protein [Magnetospirillum sp. UT-4]|uniref:LapA family protein n=1 Tax=Magnetospirillum sp. UT-4 TaxID=2681467 RepID=UPI00137FA883|nr:LapA family protein [Magnetospirillum sp. UT-4]CAA7611862.1 conserved exported hypothetical protein [Magnetospirillum sp. UT-4]
MRVVARLLALPVAVVVVTFAVANRHDVRLDFWPLPWVLDLPVYLAVLGALAIGLAAGVLLAWAGGHGARARARTEKRRAESLERQLAAAQAPVTSPPILPPADHHAA